MARANSWNIEFDLPNGATIKPLRFGEFSEGAEGRIEVADGERKYKVRDQIYSIDEVEVAILIKRDKVDYNAMQDFVKGGVAGDVFVRFVDAEGATQLTFMFKNCDCTFGKKNAFDRGSKASDSKTYFLIPEDIEEVV